MHHKALFFLLRQINRRNISFFCILHQSPYIQLYLWDLVLHDGARCPAKAFLIFLHLFSHNHTPPPTSKYLGLFTNCLLLSEAVHIHVIAPFVYQYRNTAQPTCSGIIFFQNIGMLNTNDFSAATFIKLKSKIQQKRNCLSSDLLSVSPIRRVHKGNRLLILHHPVPVRHALKDTPVDVPHLCPELRDGSASIHCHNILLDHTPVQPCTAQCRS